MAWVTFSTVANLVDNGYYVGDAMLQYDDTSTGTLRNCRLQFNLNPGASVSIYFRNVVISGGQVAAQVLVQGTTTVWSGQLTVGHDESFSFTCPWYSGSVSYSGHGVLPGSGTAPTGLAISNVRIGSDSLTATVSVTDWGGVGDATTRYRNLSVWSGPNTSYSRKFLRVYGNELSSDITIDNSISGTLASIEANTQYWYYASTSNGTQSATTAFTAFTTYPAQPTVAVIYVTSTSAKVTYSLSADGGYYDKILKYSINNGTSWHDATTTLTGGSARSGVFTIPNLTPDTTYTLKTRLQTSAGGYTTGQDISFTTSGIVTQTKMLGSANSIAEKIGLLYGSVNDQSAFVVKLYGPEQVTTLTYTVTDIANNTGFDSTTFMSKYNTEYGDLTKEPGTLLVGEIPAGSGSMKAFLYDSNNTMIHLLFDWTKYSYNDEGLVWGFASEPASGTVTSTSTTQTSYQTKRIF